MGPRANSRCVPPSPRFVSSESNKPLHSPATLSVKVALSRLLLSCAAMSSRNSASSSRSTSPIPHSTPASSSSHSTTPPIASPIKPPHPTTTPTMATHYHPPPIDYSYMGTYFFLIGCLVFSFHSGVLLYEEGITFANCVYFVGASLFSCGSVCYAVDAEQRSYRGKGS